jgi:hypothetical protein
MHDACPRKTPRSYRRGGFTRMHAPVAFARAHFRGTSVCMCTGACTALVRAGHECVQGTGACRALVRAVHWCVQGTGACRALVRAGQKASSVRGGRHICSMFAVRVHGSTSGARRSGRTSGQSARGDRSEGCAERRLPSVGAPQLNGLKLLTQQRPAKRELSAECIGCKAGGRAWTTDPSRTVR